MAISLSKLTPKQVLQEARNAANSYSTSKDKAVDATPFVDTLPLTADQLTSKGPTTTKHVLATLSSNTKVLVRLCDVEIDLSRFRLAHSLLGEVVPLVFPTKCSKVQYAYVSPCEAYTSWRDATTSHAQNESIAKHMACLLSACTIGVDSTSVIHHYVIPRLDYILQKEAIPSSARIRIERLRAVADSVHCLPLALSAVDMGPESVMLGDDTSIKQLLNWETAVLLPMGLNAWCIYAFTVNSQDNEDQKQSTALSFWAELVSALPHETPLRSVLTAMQLGLVLSHAFKEGETPESSVLDRFADRYDWYEETFGHFCQ